MVGEIIIWINGISALIVFCFFVAAIREGDRDFAMQAFTCIFIFGILGFIAVPIIILLLVIATVEHFTELFILFLCRKFKK